MLDGVLFKKSFKHTHEKKSVSVTLFKILNEQHFKADPQGKKDSWSSQFKELENVPGCLKSVQGRLWDNERQACHIKKRTVEEPEFLGSSWGSATH